MKKNKKLLLLFSSFLLLPWLTQGATASLGFDIWPTQNDAISFITVLINYLLGIIGYLSLAAIIIGGILYLLGGSSGGNESLVTAGKKCVVASLIGLALAAAGPTFLKQINLVVFGSATAPALTDIDAAPTLEEISIRLVNFLLSLVGLFAIIGTVISGTLFLSAGANASQAEKAKKGLLASIIGIAVSGGAIILITQITKFFE